MVDPLVYDLPPVVGTVRVFYKKIGLGKLVALHLQPPAQDLSSTTLRQIWPELADFLSRKSFTKKQNNLDLMYADVFNHREWGMRIKRWIWMVCFLHLTALALSYWAYQRHGWRRRSFVAMGGGVFVLTLFVLAVLFRGTLPLYHGALETTCISKEGWAEETTFHYFYAFREHDFEYFFSDLPLPGSVDFEGAPGFIEIERTKDGWEIRRRFQKGEGSFWKTSRRYPVLGEISLEKRNHRVKIVNRFALPLSHALYHEKGRFYVLGDVAPGKSKTIDLRHIPLHDLPEAWRKEKNLLSWIKDQASSPFLLCFRPREEDGPPFPAGYGRRGVLWLTKGPEEK